MAGPHIYGKKSIIFLVILLQLVGVCAAVDYCSSSNTGSTPNFPSLYQTSGFCSNQCRADYSWAIVSGHDCWCSNSAPPSANDMSECSEPCPGSAVEERCGNSKSGMYGYIYLGSGQRPLVPQISSSSSKSSQTAVQTQTSARSLETEAKPESTLTTHETADKTTSTAYTRTNSPTTTTSLSPLVPQTSSSSSKSSQTVVQTQTSARSLESEVKPESTLTTHETADKTTSTEDTRKTSPTTTASLLPPTRTEETTTSIIDEHRTTATTTTSQTSTTASPTTASPLILISTVTVVATPSFTPPSVSSTSQSSTSLPAVTQYQLVTSVLVSMQTVTVLSTPQNGSIEVISSIATMTTTAVYNASIATMTTTAMYNGSIETPPEPPSPLNVASTQNLKHHHRSTFWNSPGKVAATFIPVGLLLVILIILFIWMSLRRRRHYNYQDADLLRFHSDVSSSGTVMQNHQESAFVYADEKGIHTSPGPRSNRNARNSSALLSTSTVAANSSSGTDSLPVSRDSKTEALLVDQRLDPSHVMSQWGESGSRVSLADDVDYSRKVLRVINE